MALNSLAALYEEQARYADAEPLYKRALGIAEKVQGPDQPDVSTALANSSNLYSKLDRDSEQRSRECRSACTSSSASRTSLSNNLIDHEVHIKLFRLAVAPDAKLQRDVMPERSWSAR